LGTKGDLAGAVSVGTELAVAALKVNVGPVLFDRRGYRYTGKVKALADAARKAGLVF
jgi:large subunit ribosomal protein L18